MLLVNSESVSNTAEGSLTLLESAKSHVLNLGIQLILLLITHMWVRSFSTSTFLTYNYKAALCFGMNTNTRFYSPVSLHLLIVVLLGNEFNVRFYVVNLFQIFFTLSSVTDILNK